MLSARRRRKGSVTVGTLSTAIILSSMKRPVERRSWVKVSKLYRMQESRSVFMLMEWMWPSMGIA